MSFGGYINPVFVEKSVAPPAAPGHARSSDPGGRRQVKSRMAHGPHRFLDTEDISSRNQGDFTRPLSGASYPLVMTDLAIENDHL